MSKISGLPLLPERDGGGREKISVIKGGMTRRVALAASICWAMVATASDAVRAESSLRRVAVGSIRNLIAQTPQEGVSYLVSGYHPGSADGGGAFRWVAARPKADHDGVIVIDPGVAWPADWSDDSDVAAWFTAAGSGRGCFVRQNVALLTPEMAGALPSPTVSTRQFAALAVAMETCRKVRFKSRATYRAAVFRPPARAYIDGNGALFERSASTANPLIWLRQSSVVEDLHVDGRQGAGVASTSFRENGIGLDDHCTARRCTATRVRRHGIGANPDWTDQLERRGLLVEDCTGYDCGDNPSPAGTGTGDGINFTNCHDSKMVRCIAYGNARSGLVATSYDPRIAGQNMVLCSNIIMEDCQSRDNAFAADINMEAITAPQFIRCRSNQDISFRRSPHAIVDGCEAASIAGRDMADYPTVRNSRIINSKRGHELLALTGASPTVSDVYCKSTFGAPAGNMVQVLPRDHKGTIKRVTAIGGQYSFRLDVDNFSELESIGPSSGIGLRWGPSGRTRVISPTRMRQTRMTAGSLTTVATAAPTAGH